MSMTLRLLLFAKPLPFAMGRAAYELGLHEAPARPLSDDPLAAREQLNKERTFRQLALFDRT
jgi:hypothetical protein